MSSDEGPASFGIEVAAAVALPGEAGPRTGAAEWQRRGEERQEVHSSATRPAGKCCLFLTRPDRKCCLFLRLLGVAVLAVALILGIVAYVTYLRWRLQPSDDEPIRLALCRRMSQQVHRVRANDTDVAGKAYCEAKAKNGEDADSLMDKPLNSSFVNVTDVKYLPEWNVSRDCMPFEKNCTTVVREFGAASWIYPSGLKEENDVDRVVFIHGGSSGLDYREAYYSGMTTRLAHYMQLPVLAMDFATEPEHPWPNNALSVLVVLREALRRGPLSNKTARNIFLVADSEGGLVALHTLALLTSLSARELLGVLPEVQVAELDGGALPLAGVVLFSPTVDVQCISPTIGMNCYKDVPNGTNRERGGPMSDACDELTPLGARQDCMWSYLEFFFGHQDLLKVTTNNEAEAEFKKHSDSFWLSPLINPYTFDFSAIGVPPLFVTVGSREPWQGDSQLLVEHVCASLGDVSFFQAEDMWHDYQEWSEGCGEGGSPIPEAIAAYTRSAQWVQQVLLQRTVRTQIV